MLFRPFLALAILGAAGPTTVAMAQVPESWSPRLESHDRAFTRHWAHHLNRSMTHFTYHYRVPRVRMERIRIPRMHVRLERLHTEIRQSRLRMRIQIKEMHKMHFRMQPMHLRLRYGEGQEI